MCASKNTKSQRLAKNAKKTRWNSWKQLETQLDVNFLGKIMVILDSKSLISKSTTLKITLFLTRDFTSSLASNCFQLFHLVFLCFLHFLLNGVIFFIFGCKIVWNVPFGLFIIFCEWFPLVPRWGCIKTPYYFALPLLALSFFFFLIVLQYID